MKFAKKFLSEVAFFQEGPGVRKFQFRNEGVKLLNVGNINKGILDTGTTKLYISDEEAYGKYKHFLVDEGDLLIASSGIVVDNFHNKIAYVKKEHLPLCLNTSTIRFKSLDSNAFSLDYLKFYLKTTHFKNQLRKLITGAAQLNFGPSHLKKIILPVPPIPDQLHIANLLTKAEKLISQRKESIRLLDEFLKSTFLEMYYKNPETDTWNEVRFEELAEKKKGSMRTGPFGSSLLHGEFTETGDVKVLGIDNVVTNRFDWKRSRCIKNEKYQELKRYTVYPNDVLISIMATLGRTAVVPKDIPLCINSKHLAAITLDKKIANPYFVAFAFHSHPLIVRQMSNNVKGAIMDGLNLTIIRRIKLRLPPIELQNKFGETFEKTEALKIQYQQSLRELENLYGSLSQRAFRGELGLIDQE
jgi:type I restriction enzyme S subunit